MIGIADISDVDPKVLAAAEVIMQRYQYEPVRPPLT
jgi:hypothetical protein